jgi:hypothetical protein
VFHLWQVSPPTHFGTSFIFVFMFTSVFFMKHLCKLEYWNITC